MVRAKLPNVKIIGRSKSCRKGKRQVFDFLCDTNTFFAKACDEKFRIQEGTLNCKSHNFVYLLKCRICGEAPYVGNAKTNLEQDLTSKSEHRSNGKNVKYHGSVFMNIMDKTVTME